ncbi:MAG: hypothetical protein ACOYON_12170 [Fimbriimonas sp.]
MKVALLGSALVALGVNGCTSPPEAKGKVAFFDASALKPDALPGERAQLILAGTEVNVALKQEQKGTKTHLLLLAHDEVFEHELYDSSPTAFRLENASDNVYTPGIDLLRFPLAFGDQWDWKGKETVGGISRNASAGITTVADKLYIDGVPVETVQVSVDLKLEAEGSGPVAHRKLAFWFAPGKGVIRREFGSASVRQPVAP